MNHPGHAMPPRELDPGTVALDGINLIEASAGTGKTYNITALFLRALLAFRDSTAELAIPNVLVVTFTEAATQERHARVRQRLVLAAGVAAGLGVLTKVVGFFSYLLLLPWLYAVWQGWPGVRWLRPMGMWLVSGLCCALVVGAWLLPIWLSQEGAL